MSYPNLPVRFPFDSPRPRPLLATLGIIATIWAAGLAAPAAAELVAFDVDPSTSSFTTASIDVEFTAVAQTSVGAQTTYGGASVENVSWTPDGQVNLDLQTGTVSLEDLSVNGAVGVSGSGQMVWAGLVTLGLVYTVIEQGLQLPTPFSMPLAAGAFAGTPMIEFTGISDGNATGAFGYSIPPQEFGGVAGFPMVGSLTNQGPDLVLGLDANAAQIQLGGSAPVSTPLNECVGFWFFNVCIGVRITAIEITIDSLIYNNTVMQLSGLAADQASPICGNAVIEAGEECDDGNLISGDGCSSTCQLESVCGNGALEEGEECDDGNLDNGDGCSDTCAIEFICGNGVLQAGEECDDGNLVNGDGCSDTCQLEAICGDGVLEGTELCDDGNLVNGDGCSDTCAPELAPEASVPSLSGWGFALLSGLLVAAGLLGMQRFAVRKT